MRRSKPAPQHEFFPGFTDVAEIGIGSLATVYRAREIGTNRLVALKLLNVRDASPRALESFERESIALGAVSSHPNIVTLYRSFLAADQRPVLVLELCQGSVGERMHGGAGLPLADVVALGIKIAGALETAHRAAILHRDVKPQNILITEFGEPALADFGVAMLQSSTQTTAGLFDFTTLHAAPELLEGGDTSAATDVYELASTLYQLIAGRAAFRAYDGESPAAVILRILRDPVLPLVNTQAPQSLSDLLRYAMSKDKGSRPPTAAEFAAGLAAVEVEQQWPRTQFLIRDARGGTTGLPTITRLPDVGPRAPTPPPAVVPRVLDEPPSVLPAAIDPRPTNARVLVERQVIERLVFEPRPPEPPRAREPEPATTDVSDDGWSAVSIVSARQAPPPQPWAPPPPPQVIEADAPRPSAQQTRVVPLADQEAGSEPAPGQAEAERAEARRVEAERAEAERAEAERAEAERAAAERAAAERAAAERAAAERAAAERAAAERAAAERAAAERAAAERAEAERAEAERLEAERIEAERVAAERAEAERREAERAEAERVAAERAEVERVAAQRVEAERAAAERAAARVVAERAAAERAAARVVAERAAAERAAAERVEAERLEAERAEVASPPPPDPSTRIAGPPFDVPVPSPPSLAASAAPPADQTTQYPIPPSGVPGDVPVDGGTGTVPTWAFRAATLAQPGAASYDDLTLDPMSLRSKVTLRAGTASLAVDDGGLSLRTRMRRSTIPWAEILGFEPRFDEGGRDARLVVLTHTGPVELAATRRPAGEVRYLHALLDAYRQRAAMTGRR